MKIIIKVKLETERKRQFDLEKQNLIHQGKKLFERMTLKSHLLVQELVKKKYKYISGKVTEAVFGLILFLGAQW